MHTFCISIYSVHYASSVCASNGILLFVQYSLLLFFQVHDIFYPFVQTQDEEITFLTVNESKTAFCHLYKITAVLEKRSYHWAKGYTHSQGSLFLTQYLLSRIQL